MSKVEYISKRYDRIPKPWCIFGAPNMQEYDKWSTEVCSICCLKMIGDTYGLTNTATLYQLAIQCRDLGGFIERKNGEIEGVFYEPLLELARSYGLEGKIYKSLSLEEIKEALRESKFILLSIDKNRVNSNLIGGHLILVHDYEDLSDTFLVNDPEPILEENGQDIKIKKAKLAGVSNSRGLILWYQEQ